MPSPSDKDGVVPATFAGIIPSTRHYSELGLRREMPSSAFRVIAHLDMDSLYAYVEQSDDPSIYLRPASGTGVAYSHLLSI